MLGEITYIIVMCSVMTIEAQIRVCGNFPMEIPLFNHTDRLYRIENYNYGYTRAVAMQYTIDKYQKQYKNMPIDPKYFAMLERHSLYLADQFQCDFLIGPFSSDNSERALSLYNLLDNELSFISVGATAKKLSNRRYYPKFFRTVPSDEYSTGAMMEMMKKFHWTNIAILYTPNDAALSAADQFAFQVQKTSGCVLKTMIADDAPYETYKKTFTKVLNYVNDNKIHVLFLFLSHQGCFSLFETTKHLNNKTKDILKQLQIVLDPNCGSNIPITKEVAPFYENMVTLQSENFIPHDFNDYFLDKINVSGWPPRGDIFQRYSWIYRKCFPPVCKTPLIPPFKYASITPVVEAVKVVLKAINHTCSYTNCTKLSNVEEKKIIRKHIYNFLNNYQKRNKNVTVHFKIDGGVSMNYDIFQFQRTGNESYDFVKIGLWDYSKWYIESDDSLVMDIHLNSSVCSEPCKAHQIQVFNETSQCCWSCENCTKTKIVSANKCVSCAHGTKASQDQMKCEKIKIYTFSTDDWLSIIVIIISTILLAISIIILIIFMRHLNSSVIKSNSPELSLCSLIGIILMLTAPLIFVQEPSGAVCVAQKLLFGLSITCCYAPLVIKTNRIYRIFLSSQNYTMTNDMLSSVKSQLTLVIGMIGTQLVVGSFWLMKDGVEPTIEFYPDENYGTKLCSIKADSFILNIIFPLVLMTASTFWAFKTRHLPETFSEIKSIGVTMYVTLFLSMISLGLVFVFNGIKGIEMSFANYFVLCFSYQAIASVNLIGQYGTKVRLIYGNQDAFEHEIDTGHFNNVVGNQNFHNERPCERTETQISVIQ